MDFKYCKLEIFIPETHYFGATEALQSVDAGHIGNYDSCMSCSQLTSYWRPLGGTSPYIGNVGEISCEPEVKVEVTVFTEKVDETIQAIKEGTSIRGTGNQCIADLSDKFLRENEVLRSDRKEV